MTLDKLAVGHDGVITAVGGEGMLRNRLLDMGITPRTQVKLQKIAPLGDPIEIQIRGYELTLRKEDAAKIEVVELSDGSVADAVFHAVQQKAGGAK